MGCDGSCMSARANQHLVMEEPRQALVGPLPGNEQITPRAELYAIFKAIKYGRSPQRVICDHLNHVVALLDWLYKDTPNVRHA